MADEFFVRASYSNDLGGRKFAAIKSLYRAQSGRIDFQERNDDRRSGKLNIEMEALVAGNETATNRLLQAGDTVLLSIAGKRRMFTLKHGKLSRPARNALEDFVAVDDVLDELSHDWLLMGTNSRTMGESWVLPTLAGERLLKQAGLSRGSQANPLVSMTAWFVGITNLNGLACAQLRVDLAITATQMPLAFRSLLTLPHSRGLLIPPVEWKPLHFALNCVVDFFLPVDATLPIRKIEFGGTLEMQGGGTRGGKPARSEMLLALNGRSESQTIAIGTQ